MNTLRASLLRNQIIDFQLTLRETPLILALRLPRIILTRIVNKRNENVHQSDYLKIFPIFFLFFFQTPGGIICISPPYR